MGNTMRKTPRRGKGRIEAPRDTYRFTEESFVECVVSALVARNIESIPRDIEKIDDAFREVVHRFITEESHEARLLFIIERMPNPGERFINTVLEKLGGRTDGRGKLFLPDSPSRADAVISRNGEAEKLMWLRLGNVFVEKVA